MYWASQLTAVAVEMGGLILVGHWADQRWGTSPWLLLAGSLFALAIGAWQLVVLVSQMSGSSNDSSKP